MVNLGLSGGKGGVMRTLRLSLRDDSPVLDEMSRRYGNDAIFKPVAVRQDEADKAAKVRRILIRPDPDFGNKLTWSQPPTGEHLYAAARWTLGTRMPWLRSIRKSGAKFMGFVDGGMMFAVPERKKFKSHKRIKLNGHGVEAATGQRGSPMSERKVPRRSTNDAPYEADQQPVKEKRMQQAFTMSIRPDKETTGCYRYKVDGGFKGVTDLYLKKAETDGKPPARLQVDIRAMS